MSCDIKYDQTIHTCLCSNTDTNMKHIINKKYCMLYTENMDTTSN